MRQISLRQPWTLGKRIGDPSGFGAVYLATAADGTVGVIKLIPKRPGAGRELLFEELAGVPNVIPIIDSGETRDAWVIAMPHAERSLRVELADAGGRLDLDAALPILIDVARALAELDGRVVHRDLKPENVLLLNGTWCLADFGIARYAEASTAPESWKGAFSPPYAAPERWRFERATSAADVYALGVTAFELVMGVLPFPGPTVDDLREQHLHEDAPSVTGAPPAFSALVTECMFKPAGARPTPKNLLLRLQRVSPPSSPGAARLQTANAAVRAAEAEEHARASAAMSEGERRMALFATAELTLKQISASMRQAIVDNAAAAVPVRGTQFDDWALGLGTAVIGMDPATVPAPDPWGAWKPKFDVIAFAAIAVLIPADRSNYQGRTHTLWYCDALDVGVYRWFETGFMVSPILPKRSVVFPLHFAPSEEAGKALSNAMTEWQVAWPFTPIDQGDGGPFIERWLDWFGRAAAGELTSPSRMPERPVGTWRR